MSRLWDFTCVFGRLLKPRVQIRSWRVQTEGAEGSDIYLFQRLLNSRSRKYGIEVEETGVYDNQTRHAVSEFQRVVLNVRSDGFVGPQTARKLRIRLLED